MAINRIKTGAITDATIQSGDIAPGTIANDRLAGSVANAKLANSAITINGTSIALGASGEIVAGTDWQAVTVADGSTTLTAQAGKGYFLDTNAGVIEVFLPTSPSRGDTVVLVDYSGTFSTNKVLVNTGGKLIDSTVGGPAGSNEFQITANNSVVELVFVDNDKGWLVKNNEAVTALSQATGSNRDYDADLYINATGGTVTTSGNFKIHTFTGDGNFVVSKLAVDTPAPAYNTVSYMVVAGGGGGSAGSNPAHAAGGGGAGGFREGKNAPVDSYTASPIVAPAGLAVSVQTYPITVGGGGPAGPGCATEQAGDGSNSVFSTITSTGGGGGSGSAHTPPGSKMNGRDGGSGGGGSSQGPTCGGSGNTPPVSPAQGNDGGNGLDSPPNTKAGGGGGATAVGGTGTNNVKSGDGGAGATTCITGSPTAFAGGGGGGGSGPSGQQAKGNGGAGGGGDGGCNGTPGVAGTANTGGGSGGGKGGSPGGTSGNTGGKGIVVIRYRFQ